LNWETKLSHATSQPRKTHCGKAEATAILINRAKPKAAGAILCVSVL